MSGGGLPPGLPMVYEKAPHWDNVPVAVLPHNTTSRDGGTVRRRPFRRRECVRPRECRMVRRARPRHASGEVEGLVFTNWVNYRTERTAFIINKNISSLRPLR